MLELILVMSLAGSGEGVPPKPTVGLSPPAGQGDVAPSPEPTFVVPETLIPEVEPWPWQEWGARDWEHEA